MKEDLIKIEGTILENLPQIKFRVELETGKIVIVYLSGKLRQHKIKLIPGDKVNIELSPYDLNNGRIVYRR
jgi:translation initiation factor IF-1